MKLSVSLSREEVDALDRFVEREGLGSRSAGLQRAIRLLSGPELAAEYAEAFAEWESSGEGDLWAAHSHDGLTDETW